MKLKASLLAITMGLTCFSLTAQADIKISLPRTLAGDICENVAGNWSGIGSVKAPIVPKCDYTGAGTMSIPAKGDLTIDLSFKKSGGWDKCPDHLDHVVLHGHCVNGVITVKTPGEVDLSGSLSDDGKSAHKIDGIIVVEHIPTKAHLDLKKD